MSEYVKNWKAEHAAIMDCLNSAVILNISSKAGQEKMMEAKNMILDHLKSEDEILYPMAKQAARKKVSMERLTEIFRKEIDELAPRVMAFFKEYEDDPSARECSLELRQIMDLLRLRISREENIFMKEYENITDHKG